jgi:hypothetical protein
MSSPARAAVLAAGLLLAGCSAGPTSTVPGPTVTVTQTLTAAAQPGPTVTVTESAEPAGTVTVTATVTAEPVATPAAGVIVPGMYIIGDDIRAGTYRTVDPVDGLCYFDVTTDAGEIIAQEVVTSGRAVLRVPNRPGATVTIHEDCGPVKRA